MSILKTLFLQKCLFFPNDRIFLWKNHYLLRKNLKFSPPFFSWNGPKILLFQPFLLPHPALLNPEMEECAHMPNNTQVHYCLRGCIQCAQVGPNFCQSLKLDLFYKLGLKFVLMGHLATNDVFLTPWHPLYSFLSCNITKHLDLQERHALLFDV